MDPVLCDHWHTLLRSDACGEAASVAAPRLGDVAWRIGDRIKARPDPCVRRGAQLSVGRACRTHALVGVGLGSPTLPSPALPKSGRLRFRTVLSGAFGPAPAAAPSSIESVPDSAHSPVVHEGGLGENLPAAGSQRPGLLPPDLQAERHWRSDRTAIA
jgi:hypothetical protein